MEKLAPKFEEILKKNGKRLLKQERKLEEGSTVVITPGSSSIKIGFAGQDKPVIEVRSIVANGTSGVVCG